ncbi:MAG: Ni/Fe-hydrogenase, b-type cytochrome subunit [Rhodothermales bacterium]
MDKLEQAAHRYHLRFYVYVWEFPVRLFHWVNALCVVVLAVTGYLMGNPLAISSAAEASQQYWFGTVRFIHFLTAYVWVAVAILRLYWGFAGNEHVRFKNFLPLKKEQWREIRDVLRMDVLQIWKGATFSIGHNALAGLTYAIVFLAFLFQVITGFGMYTAMSSNWLVDLFTWVVPLFGGDHIVRLWHHMMLWFFAMFFVVHVYLAAFHDYVEATGTISSMVGGWKFVRQKPKEEPGGKVVPPVDHLSEPTSEPTSPA